MNYYHVVLGSKHIDLVQADTPEESIQTVERRFGQAIQFSSIHHYRAVRA